ncbi:MAG: STAS domain-containing protein [Myxococcota bacterium]|nr:hypothetical protein [Deltaproteobacteria bacterium]MDQ3334988.1 STAS domain-containing protein [Myxococcota bacterium]
MLEVTITHTADRTEIRLVGSIDHNSAQQFGKAFEGELRPTVSLNLKDVRSISSYGVGLLLRHLSAISRQRKVEFAQCSETMVDQFQMLQFGHYGRITSFRARYACPRCERTDEVMLDVAKLSVDRASRVVKSPDFPCACGGKLVVDDSLEFVIDHV